ncbi:LamG domain-containing protein [Actinomadura monticuli]|uniref:LamG domain-containing protein n=1 Tax=Actinomadura monticuli TaxID=3097367 RepID=A0ABV4QJI9_9ACTN
MYANPGTKCLPSSQAKIVNDFSILYAYLKDPDDEDKQKVQGQFTLHWANNPDGSDWGPKWTSGLVGPKTTGSRFDMSVPPSIPEGTKIGWGVRAWDGEQWGPWSYDGAQTGCYFYYEPAKPGDPTITSTDYPQDGADHGGVGQAGTFTISDPAGVADRFEIILNDEPVTTVQTTAGAAQQVQLAPTRTGQNVLTVQGLAPSNQVGPVVSYEFRANAGSAPLATFKLDEPAGATNLQAVTREGEPVVSAAVHGGMTTGAVGHVDRAAQLDGSTGYASTSEPLIDTSKSFAVSAWVHLNGDDRTRTVLSQDGENKSGFYLKYEPATQKWVLSMVESDSSGMTAYQAYSPRKARFNAWTHLTGVYDHTKKRLQIYVNGEPGTPSPIVPAAWNATGGFQIGRSLWLSQPADHWPGLVDDVRVYDRIVGADEAEGMVTEHPVLSSRWMLNVDGQADPYPPLAPGLVFHNGASLDADAGLGWGTSPAGLMLAADKAFAETPTPPVRTDESFTIAGWVRNTGRPLQGATVFSQPGAQTNAFALRYMPGEDPEEQGGWQVVMRNSDDAAATPLLASHSNFQLGEWVHVAVVHDALRQRISLYVNGQLDATSDGVSQEDGVLPFEAKNNGGLQVGRNKFGAADGTEFWPDAIDDVWAYQGALTPQQIAGLAVDMEFPAQIGP